MQDDLFKTVLSNTYTKTSLLRRLAYLRSYLEHKHFSKSRFRKFPDFLKDREAGEEDMTALKEWVKAFSSELSQATFYKRLAAIRKQAGDLPMVTVYLPFSVPETEVTKMGEWFRKQVKPELMMDLKVDSAYVGGCALIWKGYYRDFSLHSLLNEKKEEIMQIIDGYTKEKKE